jgi:hypothetical protein
VGVLEVNDFCCDPIVPDLFRDKVSLGNLKFLLLRISGNLDYLHPVQESWVNGVKSVGSRDEEDI